MKLLKKSDYKIMPWKNGGGSTAQMALFPESASFPEGDFLWRVSSATIASDGAFSLFPGCDRWLVFLSGDGLLLNGVPQRLHQPFHFSGEAAMEARLLGAPVVDLGLIYRRDQVQADMAMVPLKATQKFPLAEGIHFFFGVTGAFAAGPWTVTPGELLQISGPDLLELKPLTEDQTQVLHLKIVPLP